MVFRTLTTTALMAATSFASPANVAVYENARLAETTEGDALLATDPETAFTTTTDYARWPKIFAELKAATITEQQGVDARVRLVHDDGSVDHLHFHNRPNAHTVWFEQLGGDGDVWAELSFVAGEQTGTTHVHSRVYAAVHGLAAMLVSDAAVREQREHLVRASLAQLQAYFARSSTKH
jgi:hypothetical protein